MSSANPPPFRSGQGCHQKSRVLENSPVLLSRHPNHGRLHSAPSTQTHLHSTNTGTTHRCGHTAAAIPDLYLGVIPSNGYWWFQTIIDSPTSMKSQCWEICRIPSFWTWGSSLNCGKSAEQQFPISEKQEKKNHWRRRCRVRSEPVRETMSSMHPPLILITNFPRIWYLF